MLQNDSFMGPLESRGDVVAFAYRERSILPSNTVSGGNAERKTGKT